MDNSRVTWQGWASSNIRMTHDEERNSRPAWLALVFAFELYPLPPFLPPAPPPHPPPPAPENSKDATAMLSMDGDDDHGDNRCQKILLRLSTT